MTTKEKAESYFNRIGEGHENAVMRPADGLVDRSLRRMVEWAIEPLMAKATRFLGTPSY